MKKWSKIVCIAVILVAIIVTIVRSNSLNISLFFNGYQKLNNTSVLENRDNNGNEVRILKVSKKENKVPALAFLTKNNFGFWEFNYGKSVPKDGMAEMFFVKTGDFEVIPFRWELLSGNGMIFIMAIMLTDRLNLKRANCLKM